NPESQPLVRLSGDRDIALPPCATVETRPRITVSNGDTIKQILRREMGIGPNDQIISCQRSRNKTTCSSVSALTAVARLNGETAESLDALAPGRVITLPNSTRWTSVELKPGLSPEAAIDKIRSAADANPAMGAQVVAPPELDIIRPLEVSDARIKDT